jgi:hypothetical protein
MILLENEDMATKTKTTPAEELERAVEDLMKGVRDPAAMKKAGDQLDRSREALRKKFGELDLAVELSKREE